MNGFTIVGAGAAAVVILVAAVSAQGQCQSGTETARVALRGVHFVPNHGQWADGSVRYGFKSRGVDIAFRESSLTLHLSRECAPGGGDSAGGFGRARHGVGEGDPGWDGVGGGGSSTLGRQSAAPGAFLPSSQRGAAAQEALALGVTFPGSNAAVPVGAGPRESRFNYFLGDDESKWRRDVRSFGAVIYQNLYDGIDLHVTGADGGVLKYEFHCAPGADHTRVRIRYDGAGALRVSDSGDLLVATAFGTLLDNAPRVWQDINGQRRGLSARFEALDAHTYTIKLLTAPDPSHPLVIDPEVEWMTYLGGSGVDWGFDIALHDGGAVLLSGHTTSADFAGANNSYHGASSDAFVARVHPSGTIEWMTYLGGSSFDLGRGMALDDAGHALLTGWTNSDDFARANNLFHGGSLDVFVARVSPTGTLDWVTYLGGSADDLGFGLTVDAANAALLTGEAYSTDFEGANNVHHGGNYDAFAARVHSSGTLDWMTYLGGSDQDEANGIAVDREGAALVMGDTYSTNFEGRNNFPLGNRDAFVARVHPSGTVDWMTYLGGSGNEVGYGIALDDDGAALTTGATVSLDFFGRNNSHHGGGSAIDGFVARVPASGTIEWMTYLGGSGEEFALRVATDAAGAALVSGSTKSTDFEGRENSFHGVADAYVARIPPLGTIEWMTYLGGSGDDAGFGIAIDAAGDPLLTGRTNSADFPGQSNTYHGGGSWGDAFLLKLGASCYPDCNASGQLTVADFGCFQTKFIAGDPHSDCNADGQLTVADFGCFQTKFVLGCP